APRTGLRESGAGNETRTRDPDLGKVVLYQLSYSRVEPAILRAFFSPSTGLTNFFHHPRAAPARLRARTRIRTTGSGSRRRPAATRRSRTPESRAAVRGTAGSPARPSAPWS